MYVAHSIVTDPTVKEAFKPLQLPPVVWAGLVFLGIVAYAAHGHGDDH